MLLYTARGAVWIVVYLLFVTAPLFALLAGAHAPTRDYWTEFAVAIGYSGLAMMGLQFGLTARFRHVTQVWGEDVIYHFHRQLSLIAVGLVVAHALIMAVYLTPKILGTRDFAFPRLTAYSYWCYLFGATIVTGSLLFGVAPDGGWFMPDADKIRGPATQSLLRRTRLPILPPPSPTELASPPSSSPAANSPA